MKLVYDAELVETAKDHIEKKVSDSATIKRLMDAGKRLQEKVVQDFVKRLFVVAKLNFFKCGHNILNGPLTVSFH